MPRVTLAQAKDDSSGIAAALGICSSSPKFLSILNQSQQRLLPRGKWVGTYGRFEIEVTNGLITWMREVETPEGLDICSTPVPIRNEWYEFSLAGPGFHRQLEDGTFNRGCISSLIDRGSSPLILDIDGERKIKVYIDNVLDVGKTIFFKAKDADGNKIYQNDGEEGFSVTMANPSVLDSHVVTEVYGVIKAETVGAVRVYQYNPIDASQELIAVYAPDETTPSYRRSFLSNVDPEEPFTVISMAKMAYIPAKRDTDFLVIGCMPALKEMCTAIKMAECERWDAAELCEARAIRELEKQLESYLGDSSMPILNVSVGSDLGPPVQNLI